ncbi:MAG: hypothetical protein M3Z83_07830 [Actinomycetota bacterium]|nr:hypothetical protein [Actinomycetota bacterium]
MDVNNAPAARAPEVADPAGERAVRRAYLGLRSRLDERWVEIADDVVTTSLTATRRSRPVRAQGTTGPVQISESVLVSYLRDAIDGAVPGSALAGVQLSLGEGHQLVGVLIKLVGQYGLDLIPIADAVRLLAVARLVDLLGPVDTPVTVQALHVHYSDVTKHDPHTGVDAAP